MQPMFHLLRYLFSLVRVMGLFNNNLTQGQKNTLMLGSFLLAVTFFLSMYALR